MMISVTDSRLLFETQDVGDCDRCEMHNPNQMDWIVNNLWYSDYSDSARLYNFLYLFVL